MRDEYQADMPEAGEDMSEEFLPASEDGMQNMYLTFTVGEVGYGIEIRHVIQIIGIGQDVTQMPEMPPEMKGFINLRGIIIPVFSLRLRFGLPDGDNDDRNCIVVVNVGGEQIGLIVDSIRETLAIEPDRISDPKVSGTQQAAAFVSGIARVGAKEENVIILISLEEMFR